MLAFLGPGFVRCTSGEINLYKIFHQTRTVIVWCMPRVVINIILFLILIEIDFVHCTYPPDCRILLRSGDDLFNGVVSSLG